MSRYLEVISLLRRQMNGAVSEAMRDGGVKYAMNYGVSLITIKDIAEKFAPDHQLATDLWRQEIREAKLAAVFIEDTNCVTMQQAESWANSWESNEIAQICAMEMLWKCEDALKIANEWFDCVENHKHIAACCIIGKIAPKTNPEQLQKFITPKNNAYALREIYKHHKPLQKTIREFAHLVDDLLWQLDYL